MKILQRNFVWLFILLVIFDFACGFEMLSDYRIFSKPLLLISLLFYFIVNAKTNQNQTFYLMLGALFCSLLGDVFLLFDSNNSLYFTLGLASFLIAHILFAMTFFKKRNSINSSSFLVLSMILISYGLLLFYILNDNLGSLQIPVIVYIIGIMAMVITALKRKGKVPQESFNLVIGGALFFVVSDSVLAINKFLTAVPLSHIIVMTTYATAQFLITKGILIQGDFDN